MNEKMRFLQGWVLKKIYQMNAEMHLSMNAEAATDEIKLITLNESNYAKKNLFKKCIISGFYCAKSCIFTLLIDTA